MEIGPELVFALVGAIGADLSTLSRVLSECLTDVAYRCEAIRLSDLLKAVPAFGALRDEPLDARYSDHMEAGTQLREKIGRADAVTSLGVQKIRALREQYAEQLGLRDTPPPRVAYVLHSLKRPEEVETLRKMYSPGVF